MSGPGEQGPTSHQMKEDTGPSPTGSAFNIDDVPHFTNSTGQKIFCKYWSPELGKTRATSSPRALAVIVHGFAEHCEWYNIFASPLLEHGIMLCGHDDVGHGKSEGERAYVSTFSQYVDDLLQHVTILRQQHPKTPLFLIGHSMGGLISVKAILERQDDFAGAVLIGPLLKTSPESATLLKVMAAKLLAYVLPHFQISQLPPEFICRDADVVRMYEEDALNYHGGVKAGWAVSVLGALQTLEGHMAEINIPLLIQHGTCDKLTEIDGSRLLHKMASSKDKTLSEYENAYHQLHREPDGMAERVIGEAVTWIVNHIHDEQPSNSS